MYISLVDRENLPTALRELCDSGRPGVGGPLVQMLAHAPEHAERLFPSYYGLWFGTRLEPKLRELARLAIAATTGCPICQAGRLPDSIEEGMTEEDVAHVTDPDWAGFNPRERAAVRYAYLFGSDHEAIGHEQFVELHGVFSEPEIVELAMLCAQWLGYGRLVRVFDLVEPTCAIEHAVHAGERR